jgi:hypothetical protein
MINLKEIENILYLAEPALDIPIIQHPDCPSNFNTNRERYSNTAKLIYEKYLNKNWESFWGWFPSEKLFLAFLYIHTDLDEKTYWKFLGDVLNRGIYFSDYPDLLQRFLNYPYRDNRYRRYMMDKEERKTLSNLKEGIIYRGCTHSNIFGYSWTLDYNQALFFAERHVDKILILQGYYKRKNVIAYFSREQEIFIESDKIKNISIVFEKDNIEAKTNIYKKNLHDEIKYYTHKLINKLKLCV